MLLKQENQIFKKVLPHTGFLPPNKHFLPIWTKYIFFWSLASSIIIKGLIFDSALFDSNPRDFIPNHETLLQTKEIYSKPRDFIHTLKLFSKPREFTHNPGNLLRTQGNLLQSQGLYSKPREFTPCPWYLLQSQGIYQRNLLQTQELFSEPWEFTPNPETLVQT